MASSLSIILACFNLAKALESWINNNVTAPMQPPIPDNIPNNNILGNGNFVSDKSFIIKVVFLTTEIRRGGNQPLQKPQRLIPRRLD